MRKRCSAIAPFMATLCEKMMPSRRFIDTYTHGGSIGVMIEIACETIVPLQSADFAALVQDLAMQVAAEDPDDVFSLVQQTSIKNPEESVSDLLAHAERHFSERIQVIRFIRWSINDPSPGVDEPPPKSPANMMRVVK